MTSSNDLEYIDIKRLSTLPDVVADQRGWELFAPHGLIEMNVRRKPMDDVRFRQAVTYAIDRSFIKNQIFFGFGEIPTGPIGRRTKFYDGNVRTYPFDPAKAAALLDEMGLKPDARGERVHLKLMKMPFGDTWTRTAEYVKQALQKVGIVVDLESPDVAGWVKGMANWEFDMVFDFPYQFGDPALGVARTYITSNIQKGVAFTNTIGYSNPKVDELFEKAAAETDQAKRQADYSEVQKLLVDDAPADWLIEITLPTLHRKKLHNVITTAIGYAADFDNVWIAK
jgi:peptide/nickel transport system substrate-binding protein